MVTWTFDLLALLVGFGIGFFLGGLVAIFVETRDGGSWSKGFDEGCNLKHIVEDLNKLKERSK